MKLTGYPSPQLRGTCTLPGDKSISHRTALFASLAEGESRLENFLNARVTQAMLHALRDLNVEFDLDQKTLTLLGKGTLGLHPPSKPLHCGHSATTMRLLAGALTGANIPCVLDGSSALRKRPMDRIVKPLREMGADIVSAPGDHAPLQLRKRAAGSSLEGRKICLPVASAQVKSALLLAGLGADGKTRLQEPGPSRDHSERLLTSMGVRIERNAGDGLIVLEPPSDPLLPLHLHIPGDISAGSFLICAALIVPGSEIKLCDVGLNPTRTGLLDALQAMGADLTYQVTRETHGEPIGDILVRSSDLHGIEIAGPLVVRMIDEFPVFSIVAAFAAGITSVRDAQELRYKESDRITRLCQELDTIGVDVRELPDGFQIVGSQRIAGGATVQSHGDHRLAMALALAGLGADAPITVHDGEFIHESFPEFIDQLSQLGAKLRA